MSPTEHVVCSDRATAGPLGRAGGAGEALDLTAQGRDKLLEEGRCSGS